MFGTLSVLVHVNAILLNILNRYTIIHLLNLWLAIRLRASFSNWLVIVSTIFELRKMLHLLKYFPFWIFQSFFSRRVLIYNSQIYLLFLALWILDIWLRPFHSKIIFQLLVFSQYSSWVHLKLSSFWDNFDEKIEVAIPLFSLNKTSCFNIIYAIFNIQCN